MLVTCTSAGTQRHPEMAEGLNWKMKALKASTLLLLLDLFSFDQLCKLQEQLYHLRWSTKDVAERALQEGVKQAKLPGVTGRAVQEIINQALEKLEEMQVPMRDYALKSAGAVTLYKQTSSKALPVQIDKMGIGTCPGPDNHPGNCWPFPGSQGHVFIKLSMPVIPRAVTMAHVSGTAFHGESISGAPKDFAVYGFKEEHEEQGTFLGQFTFLATRNPVLRSATVEAGISLTVWTPSAHKRPHPVGCTTAGLPVKRPEILDFLRVLLVLAVSSDMEAILFPWLSREGNEMLY
ncbi:hypothetical protein Q9966_016287 [Columba livia]|nr:hypothetical protein Q9966_016287 [Columba livia]